MSAPLMCGLCGIGNGISVVSASQWSGYYRAIYCTGKTLDEPRLSGLARWQEQDTPKYVPPYVSQRFDDADFDPAKWVIIQGINPAEPGTTNGSNGSWPGVNAWGFRFHESCWKVLEQASAPDPVNLKILWRILYSVPRFSLLPLWGHNFGGLYLGARRENQPGGFLLLFGASNLIIPSAYHDPYSIPELMPGLLRIQEHIGDAISADKRPRHVALSTAVPKGSDPFATLPLELRELILLYVATEDVLPFLLSSRVLAAVPLTQHWFQSRFWPGRELDVIFDGFVLKANRVSVDWRWLYRWSKDRIKYRALTLGERNRHRIWDQTVRPMIKAIDRISSLSKLRGKSNWLHEPADAFDVSFKSIETPCTIDFETFGQSKKHLFGAEIHLPPTNIEAIHVSLIEFFGMKFISGLVFETQDGQDIEIGYITTGSEEPILVEGILEGLHVAVDDCGFRAISPYTGQHMQSEYLDWVGNRDNLPIQVLRCTDGAIQRIRATFDGFRLQGLHIPESTTDYL
ncbi:hypothetical protein F4777DRAFT_577144 [Nemania sp. FL0916]|nr:hypothetical protein F4777DRAFT_577144 [Nemania sp. FL0916]